MLLQTCAGRLLGQDVGWLDSPADDGMLPGIGKEPSGWLCASIPRIDRGDPIPHNCLEIDNISLSCSIAAALIRLGFRHNYLPQPRTGRRWGVSLLSDNSKQFLIKNLDLLRLGTLLAKQFINRD